MVRLKAVCKQLIKLLLGVSITAAVASEEGSLENNPIQIDDLTELSTYLEMIDPHRRIDEVLGPWMQLGMTCGEITLSGWSCEDANGNTYTKEVSGLESLQYELHDHRDLRNLMLNKQGNLLAFSPSTFMNVPEYDLKPFSSLKYLFVKNEHIGRVVNVPDSVEYIYLSTRQGANYELFDVTPNLKVLNFYYHNPGNPVDLGEFPVMSQLEQLYILSAGEVRNFNLLPEKFPNLKEFSVGGINVSGDKFQVFTELPKLERLRLSNGTPNDPWEGHEDFLTGIPNLKWLFLRGFGEIDPGLFENTPELERLSFESASTSLEALPELQNLKYLNPNGIESLEGIERLAKLEALNLERNTVGSLEPLKHLSNLYWLDLSDAEYRTLDGLEGLQGLRYLDLEANPLQDISALSHLTSLEELKIGSVTGEGQGVTEFPDLSDFNELRKVEIIKLPVTEIGPFPTPSKLETFTIDPIDVPYLSMKMSELKVTGYSDSPDLETFLCGFCLKRQKNEEVARLIDANIDHNIAEKRAEEEADRKARRALYDMLKLRWEDEDSD